MNHNFLIINIMIHHTFYQMCNCTHYYKCVIVHITTLQSRRKMCQTIFRDKSREISDLSRYIGDFPRYIAWSTRSQRSQRATVKVKCATMSRYSAPLQTICFRGDLNPKPKGLGFSLLAIWANSPLWYKVH